MRTTFGITVLLILSACGAGEEDAPAVDQAAVAPAGSGTMASDFHGTWEGEAVLEGTPDPVPVTIEGAASGWTMTLPGRDRVALTASVSADSLILESEPYESILQEGITVRIRTASVLQDGRMTGAVAATYLTPEGERVVPGTLESTRTAGM